MSCASGGGSGGSRRGRPPRSPPCWLNYGLGEGRYHGPVWSERGLWGSSDGLMDPCSSPASMGLRVSQATIDRSKEIVSGPTVIVVTIGLLLWSIPRPRLAHRGGHALLGSVGWTQSCPTSLYLSLETGPVGKPSPGLGLTSFALRAGRVASPGGRLL